MSNKFANASGYDIRQAIRAGEITGNTSGMGSGLVQANLVILPEKYAADFLRFCQFNPKPCPLIAMSDEPGNPIISVAGKDVDIRTDIPQYRLFQHGELQQQVSDISSVWRDDLVVFLLGCSFSFEEPLISDGIEVRNISENVNVPMYDTNIACRPAGIFRGNMVVSMRPMLAADAIRAIQICSRFPQVHGAPVHLGDPSLIGISELSAPNYGDAVTIKPNELPVFWACGVTPQAAINNAKPDFSITHSPGCMLVTDIANSKLSIL
ncbi:MAG: putative hydro-lyase [Gammaproteobacteria bacterium]|nr:putative hydro-lyase [Gammaproteobacteria bacterium]